MGTYTTFNFNSELKKDVPQEVLHVLRFMLGEVEQPEILPKHSLFNTDRWSRLFNSDSYRFDADSHSILRYDAIAAAYYLCIGCNVKNYCSEIEKFLDWISPYLCKYKGDFLGFTRHEETEVPTLIYYKQSSLDKPICEVLIVN